MFDWLFRDRFKKDIEKISEETVHDYFKSKEFDNMIMKTIANSFEKMAHEPKNADKKEFLLERAKIVRAQIKEE